MSVKGSELLSRSLALLFLWYQLDQHQLGAVEDPRDPRMVSDAAADHASSVKHARGVLGEDPLSRGIDAL